MCGTTSDFCVETESETGAPGTPAPGTHGCVQNCGMEVVNNKVSPSKFYKLGYFEGWNLNGPGLRMDARVTKDHKQYYTDVHFSFAYISEGPDYDMVIPDEVSDQWRKFLTISGGPRKTIAFGGWAFSPGAPTYHLFREATTPVNRKRFAENCVRFARRYDLDGLDFDWEYPGAPDIPGIPPGGEDEGITYLEFLKLVRSKLDDKKTLSIAAPASFWYLKQFPIASMHQYLDYIVNGTQAMPGQTPLAHPGSCLRSHVNWTETYNALTMMTKAGVPAHKILMGVSTYGRSFKMAQAESRDLWDMQRTCEDSTPYDTLEELENDTSIATHCLSYYSLEVLENRAQAALVKYHALVDDGCDRNFKAFQRAVHRSARDRMTEWVVGVANEYFDCYSNRTKEITTCAPDWDINAVVGTGNTTWYLKEGEEDAFHTAVLENIGITKEDGYRWGFRLGIVQDDLSEVVDALTEPVLLIEESVKNMQDAYDMGEEVLEQEETNLMLAIVQTVLFVIPFIGKALAPYFYKISQASTEDERAILGLGIAITGLGAMTNFPSIREAARLRKIVSASTARKVSNNEDTVRSRSLMQRTQDTCYMMSGALPALKRKDVEHTFNPREP
ncbi:hypothetical protein ACHAQH_009253 [Verticillium albo-atrum]